MSVCYVVFLCSLHYVFVYIEGCYNDIDHVQSLFPRKHQDTLKRLLCLSQYHDSIFIVGFSYFQQNKSYVLPTYSTF